jgi:hypothetical protein
VATLLVSAALVSIAVPSPAPAAAAPVNRCLSVDDPSVFADRSPNAGAIYRLYCAFFLRPPDDEGFRYWLDVAETTSMGDIAASFVAGIEFQTRYGSRSDRQFVDLVYTNVMNRLPDMTGRNYWAGLLEGAINRGEMMIYFSDSLEYRYRTLTDVRFANCTEARSVGAAPMLRGEPGYGSDLDRDDDGVACET